MPTFYPAPNQAPTPPKSNAPPPPVSTLVLVGLALFLSALFLAARCAPAHPGHSDGDRHHDETGIAR